MLLTNFSNYVTMFAKWNKVEVMGADRPMQCATADGITIINFGMGSPGCRYGDGPAHSDRARSCFVP
jgi:AMP nucleosidase